MKSLLFTAVCVATAVCLAPTSAFAQGTLTPPGAPAPTMKTLDQIEPRTPINSLPFNITNSGSYYVTSNLTGIAGTNGITIKANNVELDLMGFTLTGVPSSGSGIGVPNAQTNIRIHGGNLQIWGGFGVNATNADGGRLENLHAFANTAGGLAIGTGSIINACESSANSGDGIIAADGAILKDSIAKGNLSRGIVGRTGVALTGCVLTRNLDWGVVLGDNCLLSLCIATQNNTTNVGPGAILAGGIQVGNGCTIVSCVANGNTNASFNAGPGISAGAYCNIQNCTANNNAIDQASSKNASGIRTGSYSTVRACTVISNATGILTGSDSIIQDCTVAWSWNGESGVGVSAGSRSLIRGCIVNNSKFEGIVVGDHSLVADNTCFDNNPADILVNGSSNTIVRNFAHTIVTNSISNMVGAIETNRTALNTNKNPHVNILQ